MACEFDSLTSRDIIVHLCIHGEHKRVTTLLTTVVYGIDGYMSRSYKQRQGRRYRYAN